MELQQDTKIIRENDNMPENVEASISVKLHVMGKAPRVSLLFGDKKHRSMHYRKTQCALDPYGRCQTNKRTQDVRFLTLSSSRTIILVGVNREGSIF